MSIQIDKVRISGFRGLKNIEIDLPRVAVLLGMNNSGKTSVIKALQLALGDYSRYLSDEDFYIGSDDKRQEKIIIDIRFIAVNGYSRTNEFSEQWQQEFAEKIQTEISGKQFVAIRTTAETDRIRGGFQVERFHLDSWPQENEWAETSISPRNRMRNRFDSIPFISIEAQRDIHNELKEKTSFIGKVLSGVQYNTEDITQLERMVAEINSEAIAKSESLKSLKNHLDNLNRSFEGTGQTELTPFPKKIRDLSKRFSVHYGDSNTNSFSMEYHGMGTRSWASMLTVKAFIDVTSKNYEEDAKPFFPILAAEEPEAHLHPNAQRTLHKQLTESTGQVIISTHSPYIAGIADTREIINLHKTENAVEVHQIREGLENNDLRKLKREVLHSRGEILFSKVIVLSEGETEEQALPILFEAYFGKDPYELGINFVGVSGSGGTYRPFLILAKDFNIPVYIFSDGEKDIVHKLQNTYEEVFGTPDVTRLNNIVILEGTNFESYLLDKGFKNVIEEIITPSVINKRIKQNPISGNYNEETARIETIRSILRKDKTWYAKQIAEKLAELPKDQFPFKIAQLFRQIESDGRLK